MTFIDAPQLDYFYINFFNSIDFDTPRLAQSINYTPKLRKLDVLVQFNDNFARAKLESYPCDRNLMQRTIFAVFVRRPGL